MTTTIESRCCNEYEEYQRKQWEFRQSRRGFLKTAVGAIAAGAVAPNLFINSALADRLVASPAPGGPVLVLIQLQGGNDGLNTIVPYGSGLYYQDRPTIAVAQKDVIHIDGQMGFHPNLQALKPLYDSGNVAVIQGVGYPGPDRSHFRSTTIWETGDLTGTSQTGWIGRYLDANFVGDTNPFTAVAMGATVPQTFLTKTVPVTSIESVNTFQFQVSQQVAPTLLKAYERMYSTDGLAGLPEYLGLVRQAGANAEQGVQDLQKVATKYSPSVTYPQNPLARELQLVAQMISAGLGTRVFHVQLGGFDDHTAEVQRHAALMKDFAESVSAFYADLSAQNKGDNVLTMTFSEFGRRVKENAGRGTDHGTAAPVFIVGNKVKGGLYGKDPILTNLDDNGDLKYDVDFRSVYGTVLDTWMGANSKSVLSGSYENLGFI
jgi:uncharacterized protein (DUF1501 family)